MDIQGLRDKILQLAIQGKLVEQDENDEPASALVQRIKEERDKLVREKKIKKPKKLAPIEQEEKPFEIPGSWEWVRLGEVGAIIGGGTPKTAVKEYWERGTIPWLTPSDLSNYKDKYISRGKRNITPLGLKESSAQLMPKGTVLFSSRAPIGYTVIAQNEISTNQGFKSCIPFIIDMNEYLYYYLTYSAKLINENASGTTFKEVSGAEVGNLIIPLPPFVEQKRIVEKVDELFALIDELDSNKEELLEVINLTRNQVLQEAIQGKLVEQNPEDEPASVLLDRIRGERDKLVKEKKIRKPKKLPPIEEEEKPFEIPGSWEWVRLGEVTIINPRNSFEDNKEVSFVPMALIDEGFRNNHTSETRLWKDIKRGFTHFAENDVAIAKITPCFENRKSAIMRNLVNEIGAGTTELHIIRSVNALILPEYILNICKTDRFIKEGVATYTGTAGQQRISKDYIMNLTIPLPPLAEQKRIVEKVDVIMGILDKLEKELIINI